LSHGTKRDGSVQIETAKNYKVRIVFECGDRL